MRSARTGMPLFRSLFMQVIRRSTGVAVALVFCSLSTRADVNVEGVVADGTVWGDTTQPYVVNNQSDAQVVTVPAGVTLTIAAGVTVNSGFDNKTTIHVEPGGTLIAAGVTFFLKTRDLTNKPPIVVEGTATFTDCTLSVEQIQANQEDTTVLLLGKGAGAVTLSGTSLSASTSGIRVNQGIRVEDTATLTVTANGAIRSAFSDFPEAIWWESTAGVSVSGADFARGTHGIHVDNAAVDVIVSDSTFTDYESALDLPAAKDISLTNITATQTGTVGKQVGVYTEDFTSFGITGAISNMYIGVHVSTARAGADVSGVTFTNCAYDLLAEGDYSAADNTISADTTLTRAYYHINNPITIAAGATLTIEEGVILDTLRGDRPMFIVDGALTAAKAVFEARVDNYQWLLSARKSGTITLTECNLRGASSSGNYSDWYDHSFVGGEDNAQIVIRGCTFVTASDYYGDGSWPGTMKHAVRVQGNATASINPSGAVRTTMSGFRRAVYHAASTDLVVDGLDVIGCDYAFECNTIGNVFLTDVNMTDCTNGLYLVDAGVLVTNGVDAVNTPAAFSGTMAQVLSPQISLAGMNFDANSYCQVAGGYTFTSDAVLPPLPVRIDDRSGPMIVPEGISVTFPAGSRLSNRSDGEKRIFQINGTVACTGTDMKFWTYYDRYLFTTQGSGVLSFTDCVIEVADTVSYARNSAVVYAGNDSRVTVSGCRVQTSVDGNADTPRFMWIRDNADVTVRAFDGTPSSFANFWRPIESNTLKNCPTVEPGTVFTGDALEYACLVSPTSWPGNLFTVAADVTLACSDLTIDNYYPYLVPAGVTVDIRPGSRISMVYNNTRNEFQVRGQLNATDVVFDLRTYRYQHGTKFWFLGDGRGSFTNCTFNGVETTTYHDSAGLLGATDNGQITLSSCTFNSDPSSPVARAVVLQGASRLSVPDSGRAVTEMDGFTEAIYCTTLDVFGDTPGLVFGDNGRDIRVDGGSSVTRDVTLPGNAIIGIYCYSNPIIIAQGASLTFPAGCRVDNYTIDTGGEHDAFVVQGALNATGTFFDLRTYCYANAGSKGTRVIDIVGSGTADFTDCSFRGGDDYSAITEATLIALSDGASATVRGGSFDTDPSYWDYAVAHAITVYDSASLTVRSYNGVGPTFKGFPRAITQFASSRAGTSISIDDSLFRENGIGIELLADPGQWHLQGCTFIGNSMAAISNGGNNVLDCRDNYWGHPSGPNHPSNPFGLGDSILGDAVFTPYAATGLITITSVGDHPLGQARNAFLAVGDIPDALLLRFAVESADGAVPATSLVVRLPHVEQMDDANLTNVRLIRDEDSDGAFAGGRADTVVATGVVDTAAQTITFTGAFDLEGAWLLIADLADIASGDALALRVDAEDIVTDPGLFLAGSCTAAAHYRDRLFLGDHRSGQIGGGLLAAADQPGIVLTAFSLGAGFDIQAISVTLSGISGIDATNLRNVRLLVDTDGDGQASFGEAVWSASQVQLSGAGGKIDFAFGVTPIATGTDFVVLADFTGLHRDDQLTAQVLSSGIAPVDPLVEVVGSNAPTTHTVPRPMLLLDPAFQAANGFTAATTLRSIPLLGFTVFPGGRQVAAISFPLSGVDGIAAGDITNARLHVDTNGNGIIDAGENETVGGPGLVQIDPDTRTGSIVFSAPFLVSGGDFLLVADFADLANDDALTIALRAQDATPGPNDVIEGGVTPVRHAVVRSELPVAAEQTNWTLTYRSPGGTSVSGAYSHDGTKIILGYSSGTAYLYDSDANRPLLMLHKHYDKVQYAGFSADDSLAITVTYDGAVYLWNAGTGDLEQNLFSDLLVRYATPSPDATRLFIVTEGKALLLDLATGRTLWEFVTGTTGAEAILYAADYAPDGSKVLVGAGDKRAYLLDAETGNIIRHFQGHSEPVTGVSFIAGGTRLLTTSTDGTVGIWDVADNVNPISTVSLDGEDAMGAAGSRDGTRVAILTRSGSTRRLHLFDGVGNHLWAEVLPSRHYTDKFSSIRFSDDGARVLICSNAYNDWNYPAALAVQYSTVDGEFLGFVGPRGRVRGWDWGQLEERVRVSEDGNRIFFMNSEGLDVLFTQPGKTILQSPEIDNQDAFDVTPDGRKLTRVIGGQLEFYAVDEDRLTLINSNDIGADYAPLTLSRTGATTIHGDRLIRTLSGQILTNTPNDDGAYRSAFSPDESLWGIAFFDNMTIKTMLTSDLTGSLEYGVTLTDPYKPRKVLYHPDGIRVGCVDRYAGVQFYRLDTNDPVGLYDYRSGYGIPPIYDAALSHDGTMLAIARGNSVRLFDMRTGNVLRYFYPTHSDQASCYALSVGFGTHDAMLYIAWSDNYVEIFNRSRLDSLRLSPVTRTLPAGRSQTYTVRAVYDDGSSIDVSPHYIYSATGLELAPASRLYADPPEAVTIEADKVTVNPGASGDIAITAVFSEGGITRSATATLTVGASPVVALRADPVAVSLGKGVVQPIRYYALFADGYEEEVTQDTALTADPAEKVRVAGNNVTVRVTATPGDIHIEGTYTFDGVTRTAATIISVHAPQARWARNWTTAGGDVGAMTYSPDNTLFAVGFSSGAVGIYTVGETPTQYELRDVISAHSRPVEYVYFPDNDTLVTVGGDGLVLQWDIAPGHNSAPLTRYLHDAALTCAAFYGRLAVLGDNLGRVMLYDLDNNAVVWSVDLHQGPVTAVAIDADSVLTGGKDRRVYLLDRADGSTDMTYTAFAKPPVAVALTGNVMSVLSEDNRLARWNKGSADDNLAEYFFPSTPSALAVRSDNGYLYIATQGNGSNAVWVYNPDGLLLNWIAVPPNQGVVSALTVTPDGRHIVTGRRTCVIEKETEMGETIKVSSPFHSAQFWNLSRGSYSGSLAHSYSLKDARISEDGATLFTQSDRRVIRWGAAARGNVTETRFLETGYFVPYSFSGLAMTGDAAGLIGARVRSSIYLMDAAQRLLYMSVHTDCDAFDISHDGTRLITNSPGALTRFWDISLDFPTVFHENPVTSADVAYLPDNQSLGSVPDSDFVSIFNTGGLRYSGIDIEPVGQPPDSAPVGSELTGPTTDALTVSANGQRLAVVVNYVETNGFSGESTTYMYVQVYGLNYDGGGAITPTGRLFEAFMGAVKNSSPRSTLALSHDGSLLFFGIAAARQQGHLIELNSSRELAIFTPPSMGTDSNLGPAAAQFTGDSSGLMIAWTEGYATVYRRESVDTLRLSPLARSVSAGDTVEFSADAGYADGSTADVTARTTFAVDPPGAAAVSGATVTVGAGVSPGTVITVTGTYAELGTTRTGTATLTMQSPTFISLSIDPAKISLTRGQSVDYHVFAHFASGTVEEVTTDPSLELGVDPPGVASLTGTTLAVLDAAQFGDATVTARLARDGDERTVLAAVHIRREGSMINPGDFDENLEVGFNDLLYFIGHYSEVATEPTWDSRCDFDGDDDVDFDDAGTLFGLYGTDYHPQRTEVIPANLLAAARNIPAAVTLWIDAPDRVTVGETFQIEIWARDNTALAQGFRGGPIDVRFDPERVALAGSFEPRDVLAAPFNSVLTNGALRADRISQLGGLTVLNGLGHGEPVLYAVLTFRALKAGPATLAPCSGNSGLVLTPPVGQITVGSTEYGSDTVIIDVDGAGGGGLSDQEVVYELPSGWSLIGVPLALSDRGAPPADLTFWQWNAAKGIYVTTTVLEPGRGYWAYAEQPKTLVLRGLPTTPQPLELSRGWNLVAPFIESPEPNAQTILSIFAWDAEKQTYATPGTVTTPDDTLPCKPWVGYWIFCREPAVRVWDPADNNPRR
ncbi:MAG: WD40 repeat domain-containing protein [Kiritimatiellaeota bacterium]|nr:WD40 repeat domain-containing protein [Kiritimatiellota bacterium]